jgi:hypothetical protein
MDKTEVAFSLSLDLSFVRLSEVAQGLMSFGPLRSLSGPANTTARQHDSTRTGLEARSRNTEIAPFLERESRVELSIDHLINQQ